MVNYVNDTIAALATPYGVGAIAVIRISGEDLKPLIPQLTDKSKLTPRYATLVTLKSPASGIKIDQSIITFFPGPDSYTGEDLIEISCHGGEYISRSILSELIALGVRSANPGEFSYRAFMNGKIDLVQAEAISSLTQARTGSDVGANLGNLTGKLSDRINQLRAGLLNILSIIEHELDFQEDEISFTDRDMIMERLSSVESSLSDIACTAAFGKTITNGVRLVLLGRPNTGKSSLFNTILGHERAIVSNVPGTTRDTLESWFDLGGIPVCLVDTAGYWESGDFLENLGITKTIMEVKKSDFILFVDDVDPVNLFSKLNLTLSHDRVIFIKSKVDGQTMISDEESLFYTSSKNDTGIRKLITYISTAIHDSIHEINYGDGLLMTQRQRALIISSKGLINNIISEVKNQTEMDIIASLLHSLSNNLDEVVGNITNKEIVKNIFTKFCVGK
ncbi:MAG: tRNA uridine-5-carboxymethylaminomethyl(34) synthesis GTPase MnmE [Candidatus Marinimicrobia bacterium]|jgi:tRNA modification GTPase|nr:tRNA uridine-5-carboxymethylaminomethyl(34) synthesis GTPase MnmE [Candidatus Neomarinimicrobiota bacterium]MBT3683645.1 tRNA uridine-5-carboxymethylaminomethyl(34) synthesis GTPase MnmE [Candidatus Neomarinimicrobiota bacterium]MBT3760424.1 tRNA uridine-5-carboxymethylaminomethyl(34) synthesis GTPase MnmE [Candidatus Neomarinimicrobiota bacterium]MBT3896498.1 tRNA uridine-5-carboxymethylaminomethyl(34) synthesis GTPase MnmE [Candidatus Neomarinimicrobiota bacterium]MBT4173588.1 tRNA uridine